MKNLGMVFFLAVAFIFVSSQAQAQSTTKTSCKKTCSKMTAAQKATCNKRNTAMLTLLGNDKTTKKTTSCQPAQCKTKTSCKKAGSSASAVKLVSNETATKKASCQKTCNKNVKVTEKTEKVNVTKAVLAKNE
jgi:hypothetical protein